GLEVNLIETAEEDVPLCCQNLPDEITAQFEGSFTNVGEITQSAFVTLGIFTLIRVERPAQLTMENCENCFPDKTCDSSGVFTDACTLFSSMQFPYEEFAPTVRCDRTDLSVERESQDPLLSPDDYR
ncbi:MAG: hypothetical protein J6J21_04215, partial [Clostridia bacterium]|nr:hypothetical protein [Clostridia bacterium]